MANLNIAIEILANDKASGPIGKINRSLGGLVSGGISSLKTIGVGVMTGVAAGAAGLAAGFGLAAKSAIDMNAVLETSTLQFTTLMGDSDRAEAHVKSLFDFAKKTPFETGPIIEASRMLQTFGGDALNTEAKLLLLGDASAAVSAPIEDLGFWTGRLYSQLQAGKPFGEAAMRLQELAVLSPEARNQMEALQEAGASADEIFSVFEEDLGKFNGAMELQAGTWEGLKSTIIDSLQITAATALKPFFEMAKTGLGAVVSLLENPAFTAGVEMIASKLEMLGVVVGTFIDNIRSGAPILDSFQTFITQIALLFGMAGPEATALGESIGSLISQVQAAIQPVSEWIQNNIQLSDVLTAVGIAVAVVVIPAILSVIAAAAPLILTFAAIVGAVALMRTAWENDWGGIQGKTQAVIDFIVPFVQNALATIQAWWAEHGTQVIAKVTEIWDLISGLFQNAFEVLTNVWNVWRSLFEGDWYAFGENLFLLWESAWTLITDFLAGLWDLVGPLFVSLWESLQAWWGSIDWANLGRNIIDGIVSGIRAAGSAVRSALGGIVDSAINSIKNRLGISSPSRVMAELIGEPMGQGVVMGWQNALSGNGLGLSLAGAVPAAAPVQSSGFGGGGSSVTNNWYIEANYRQQDEGSLRDDIRLLQMLTQ